MKYNDYKNQFSQKDKAEVTTLPKCYTDQEKEYIKHRLKEEAGKCLIQYGIRRTTVDDIVKRVQIPKGTFYLFYQSKELLLYDVILEEHDRIEEELVQAVSQMQDNEFDTEQLIQVIYDFFKKSSVSPVLKILNSNEIELLARKLPAGVLEKHIEHDNDLIEDVLTKLTLNADMDKNVLGAAFRAIYFITLHRDSIGEDYFEKSLYLLIRGLVLQLK